jgi:adenylate kinase
MASGAAGAARRQPNILVTGTPGCGKTSTCEALCEAVPELHVLNVNALAAEQDLYAGRDEERDVLILDDDRICDAMEELMRPGGQVVDTHALVDYMPERWFDLVIVLRTDNTVLYDRLVKRGYGAAKVQENVQAEIFGVIAEEAQEAYPDCVQLLESNTPQQLESNVERIAQWVVQWRTDNGVA